MTTTLLLYAIYIPLFFGVATERIGSQWYGAINPQHMAAGQILKLEAPWVEIEATPGVYTWPRYLDSNITYAHMVGQPVLLLFKGSPPWARDTDYQCSLPSIPNWDNYAAFLLAAIDRYKPAMVEIWNEPEAGVSAGELYWCCGCVPEPEEYVSLLNYLYPIIKAAHPGVTILGGALTQLDTAWARAFLAAKPKMDGLSWHYYSWAYSGQTAVSTSGLVARRDQLAAYGYRQYLSETAHVCGLADCGANFRQLQADWMRAVAGVSGFETVIWFTTPWVNWASCEMVSATGVKFPAWEQFRIIVETNK